MELRFPPRGQALPNSMPVFISPYFEYHRVDEAYPDSTACHADVRLMKKGKYVQVISSAYTHSCIRCFPCSLAQANKPIRNPTAMQLWSRIREEPELVSFGAV